MMETLSRLLVQQPGTILLIVAGYAALWALLRATILRVAPRANVLLVPALPCLAYAAWEWLLLRKGPEADIRFDLLLIWLVIAGAPSGRSSGRCLAGSRRAVAGPAP